MHIKLNVIWDHIKYAKICNKDCNSTSDTEAWERPLDMMSCDTIPTQAYSLIKYLPTDVKEEGEEEEDEV